MNRRHDIARRRFGLLRLVAWCSLFFCGVLPSTAGLSAEEPDPKEAEKAAERAAKDAQEAQRKQQIEQHAKHFEPSLKTFMDGELELVRKTCGSLSPAARREILAAGKKAVPSAARELAALQFDGRRRKPVDSKRMIQEAIHAAVKPHATADEFAAYERQRAARLARRDRTARASIIAKLDDGLHLSIAQRAAIAADLEKNWQEAWWMDLGDRGMNINGRGLAPDFADRCIASHLDSRQRAAWKTWQEQAGWSRFANHHFAYQPHFFGIQAEPDPWWTP
jgi:hypothetical protein